MDDVKKTPLAVGDWITIYGVPFVIEALLLHHDKIPQVVLKHPLELGHEASAAETHSCSCHTKAVPCDVCALLYCTHHEQKEWHMRIS